MLKRALSAIAVLIAGTAAVAAVLYLFFGLRVGLDGGGTPHLTFVVDNDTQADVVARHREAQRRELAQEVAPRTLSKHTSPGHRHQTLSTPIA